MSDAEDSSPQSPEVADKPEEAPGHSRRRATKRVVIGIGLAILIYLLSYGPAVTRAMNRYGQISDFYRAFYTPAHSLADHVGLYRSYRMIWAKQSRKYHWWVQREAKKNTDPLLPQPLPRHRDPKDQFQLPTGENSNDKRQKGLPLYQD